MIIDKVESYDTNFSERIQVNKLPFHNSHHTPELTQNALYTYQIRQEQ